MTYDPDPAWAQPNRKKDFIKSHDGDYLPNREVDCIYIDDKIKRSVGSFGMRIKKKVFKLKIEYSNGDSFKWEFDTMEEAIKARDHLAEHLNIKSLDGNETLDLMTKDRNEWRDKCVTIKARNEELEHEYNKVALRCDEQHARIGELKTQMENLQSQLNIKS